MTDKICVNLKHIFMMSKDLVKKIVHIERRMRTFENSINEMRDVLSEIKESLVKPKKKASKKKKEKQ